MMVMVILCTQFFDVNQSICSLLYHTNGATSNGIPSLTVERFMAR